MFGVFLVFWEVEDVYKFKRKCFESSKIKKGGLKTAYKNIKKLAQTY